MTTHPVIGYRIAARAGLSVLAAIPFALPISAEEASPNPPSVGVETIIVTAERRAENLQQAAVAATVLTGDALSERAVTSVDDLEFVTPSLTIASSGQGNEMNIRGIGKEDISGTATSAVATYRDGVGTVSGFFNGEPYYDIDNVQVLRGPQGTFVGENAAGGAIFVNTNDPEIGGGYTGYVEAGYGDYDQMSLQGAINIPLTDTLAARVAAYHLQRDSFFDVYFTQDKTQKNEQDVGDVDHNAVRGSLLWAPMDNFNALLKVDYSNINNHGYAFGVVPGFPWPAGFGPTPVNPPPGNDLFEIGNNNTDNYAKDKMTRGVLDMEYTFDGGTALRVVSGLQSIESHITNDDDGSAVQDRRINIRAKFKIYTEEITLVSPEENRLSWIAGAFWREETLDFPKGDGFVVFDFQNYVPGVGVEELTIDWHTPRTTVALFGQVAYELTDAIELEVGARVNSFHVSEEVLLEILPAFGVLSLPAFNEYSEDSVTGKIALNWQASENNFFYAFIASGNTTGGVSVVATNPDFKSQKTTNYEIGWKGTLFDGRLLTQVGFYYNDIERYQAFTFDATSQRQTFQNLEGDSENYGMEATAQAVFGALSFDVGLSLADSELGTGLLVDDVTLQTIDVEGNTLPFTPEYTFFAGAQYLFTLPGGMTLTPRIDYSSVDEQTVTPVDRVGLGGVRIDRIEDHENVNLRLTLATQQWSLIGYVTNATDEDYIEAHGGSYINAYPNSPRQYGVRLSYTF
jgi:iron complex outermembrane receptor protein